MNNSDTQVNQLILNLVESRADFDTMKTNGLIANQLYLVSNDSVYPVTSINYISSGTPKLSYTTEDGTQADIITIANLKSAFNLSAVASDGLYTSLTSKPSINNVELTGNKTTTDLGITLNYSSNSITNKPSINGVTLTGNQTTQTLGIQYGDLSGLPTIPTVSNDYIQGDTNAALTSAGIDVALSNYTPKTRTVTGTGALGGGGQLTDNLTITHNNAPTGLTTSAVKIGVDQYGHVCVGSTIAAEDINAVPIKYITTNSVASLDGSNTVIVVNCSQDESFGFSTAPALGKLTTIYCVNSSSSSIALTIPSNLVDSIFVNDNLLTADYTLQIEPEKCKRIDISLIPMSSSTICAFVNIF